MLFLAFLGSSLLFRVFLVFAFLCFFLARAALVLGSSPFLESALVVSLCFFGGFFVSGALVGVFCCFLCFWVTVVFLACLGCFGFRRFRASRDVIGVPGLA